MSLTKHKLANEGINTTDKPQNDDHDIKHCYGPDRPLRNCT